MNHQIAFLILKTASSQGSHGHPLLTDDTMRHFEEKKKEKKAYYKKKMTKELTDNGVTKYDNSESSDFPVS